MVETSIARNPRRRQVACVRRKQTVIIVGVIAPVVLAGAVTAIVLTSSANLASCLVGSWKATSNVTTLTANGRVTVNTITGLRLSYRTDGTTQQLYGDALARFNGELTELAGTVTYDYRLDGKTVSYTNGRAQLESGESQEQDYSERADCSDDRLTLTGSIAHHEDSRAEWTIELVRV
jgi:opacity protein-like surface antigen